MSEVSVPIEIDAAGINQHIAKAILDSAIGDAIRESLNDSLSDWKLKGAVDSAIKRTVDKVIYELLIGEHGDELRTAIRDRLSEGIVSDIASKAFDRWLSAREID